MSWKLGCNFRDCSKGHVVDILKMARCNLTIGAGKRSDPTYGSITDGDKPVQSRKVRNSAGSTSKAASGISLQWINFDSDERETLGGGKRRSQIHDQSLF